MGNGLTGKLYGCCEWITRLAYLNLLWILFSLAGLVIAGLIPATAAMFAVTRKWVMGETGVPVFVTFWGTYKKEFGKSNLLGLGLAVLGCLLYTDMIILKQPGLYNMFFMVMFITISFLFGIALLYLFPVYSHYDVGLKRTVKFALMIGLTRPLHTLGMMAYALVMTTFLWFFIMLLSFFTGSVFAFFTTWVAHKAFLSIQRVQDKWNLLEGKQTT